MLFLAYRGLMSIVGKNQIFERIPPRLRAMNTFKLWSSDPKEYGTVAWKKAYLQKNYCEASQGYACERPATGGSGVQGQGRWCLTIGNREKLVAYLYVFRKENYLSWYHKFAFQLTGDAFQCQIFLHQPTLPMIRQNI